MKAFVTSTECPTVSSGIKHRSALDDMGLGSGRRGYRRGGTPRWFWQGRSCVGRRLGYRTFGIGWISVTYAKKKSKDSRASDGREVSRALCRFVPVTHDPLTLQPIHNLLHLIVPIDPKDNQTTDDTGGRQSNRETNPKTP